MEGTRGGGGVGVGVEDLKSMREEKGKKRDEVEERKIAKGQMVAMRSQCCVFVAFSICGW